MTSALSKATGIPVPEVVASAKAVLNEEGFLEYAFLVRRMRCFSSFEPQTILELEDLAGVVFRRIHDKRLTLYPTVAETLNILSDGGVFLAAVTNAPVYQAYKRLVFLKIAHHFKILIGIQNPNIPQGIELKANATPWPDEKVRLITRELGKPSDYPYALLRSMFKDNVRLFSIGDSIERDLAPAAKQTYTTIWAKYGRRVDEKNYRTVLELSPKSVVSEELAVATYSPDHEIESAADIVSIVRPPRQLSLF